MRVAALLSSLALGLPGLVAGLRGRTFTSWDCCKPACGDSRYVQRANSTGLVQSCDIDNNPLADSTNVASGCDSGAAYMCDRYMPVPVSADLSYGFAVAPGNTCCQCYELFWLDGFAAGKRIEVQVVNWMPGEQENTDAGRAGDFAVLTPGGGVGPNRRGCRRQYQATWGEDYGGVDAATDCEELPDNLKGGCYWRWNWAGGDLQSWNIEYKQIACPKRLTDISKCYPAEL